MRFEPVRTQSWRDAAVLPMAATIDVVFLLLIYFMLTASVLEPERDLASALQAESEAGAGRAADFQPQVVTVGDGRARARFAIGSREVSTREDLEAILRQLPKEGGVFVRVLPLATVDSAAAALQACKNAGFTKVSYVPAAE